MDPRIDRMRGLLAMGVMIGHVFDLAAIYASNKSGIWFQTFAYSRPYFGFICVVGFIVLSGYCIARSTAAGFRPGRYVLMRITRLFPLLFVVVTLTGLLEWSFYGNPARAAMWNSGQTVPLFFANFLGLGGFEGRFGALAPAYTVSYELFYYLIWGVALFCARGKLAVALAVAIGCCAVLICFGELMRAGLGRLGAYIPALSLGLLPSWILGAWLAVGPVPRVIGRFVVSPLAVWLALAAIFAYIYDNWQKPRITTTDASDITYFITISIIFIFAMAVWLARPMPSSNAGDRWLGEISYPLFLAHGPVSIGFQSLLNLFKISLDFQTLFSVLLCINLLVATGLAYLVERPVMNWRRRLFARPAGKQAAGNGQAPRTGPAPL